MSGFETAQARSLEARTIAAQRAYVTALVTWERSVHSATCPACRSEHVSAEQQQRLCDAAEAEKEHCRAAFRDLCDQLGFVPTGHAIGLPVEDQSCCRGHSAN
ncbi:hypothetical protein V4R08_17415 (plasmid) [Nitrobacter sp. NHB1]|uniref:hypothetical protein n=1 Tax=Nitrobacter sp. NHB1 TaxID=3119830 RepID=UPI002FFD73EC